MSTSFSIRSFNPDGTQADVIPGALTDTTDELFSAGYVKLTVPRGSIGAERLKKRLEVALFREGVEVDNTRAVLVEHTGNPSSNSDAPGKGDQIVFGGKTLFSRFAKAVVYPMNWPSTDPYNHPFTNQTPGTILKTLIQRAQSRGALTWLVHSSWTGAADSAGKAWDKMLTIAYEPGVNYQSVIENLIRLGVIELRMSGRELKLFNANGVGSDLTTGGSPVVLRRGRDVIDTPYSESTQDLANVLLVSGDDGIVFEKADASSVSQYGREESSLSQGGTKDTATLNTLADASLQRYSGERGEYSVKFAPDTTGPQPFRDFQTGDWVFLDRNGALERYRVRQLSITTDDDGYEAVATLNDKFAEFDLTIAKKVEGIIGGAGSDTVTPADPPTTDTTIPNAPTGVNVTTNLYTDNANGTVRGLGTSTWAPPTTNTSGTAIDDLSHYEVEHQTNGQVSWDVPTGFGPATSAPDLTARFDRRGKSSGWIGADGGGNWTSDDATTFHAWGDTLWGTLASDGSRKNTTMPRNSMTSFTKADAYNLTSYGGVENIIRNTAARCNTTAAADGWAGLTNASMSVVSWSGGYLGQALQLTATAAGTVAVYTSVTRTTSQGNTFRPIRAGKTYRVMCTFDPTTPMGSPRVNIIWQNDAGATISTVGNGSVAGVVDTLIVAPPGATTALFQILGSATAAGQTIKFTMIGLFETTHQMQSWRLADPNVTVTNEMTNPDGAGTSAMRETRRNFVTNPGLYLDASGFNVQGNATLVRDLVNVHGATDGTPQVGVINPTVLNKWQTALDQRGITQANMVTIGTSVTAGLTTSDWHNRYQTRLFDIMRSVDYPTAGVVANDRRLGYEGMLGFIPGFYNADPWCPSLPGPEGQKSGGAHVTTYGLGGQTLALGGGEFTRFKATFDNLRMMYVSDAANGAPISVSIDGVTYNIDGKVTGDTNKTRIWDLPSAAPLAEHIVEVRNTNPPGTWGSANISGFFVYAGDKNKGVHVIDGSQSGWSAQSFAASASTLAQSYALAKPQLVTIELGYNDAGSGRTSAQYKTDLQTIITSIKNACTAAGVAVPAFLLIGGYDPDVLYTNPNKPAGSWPEPWQNYITAMKQIATADTANVAMVDLTTVMPPISQDPGQMYDGVVHPNDKGHALMASILRGVLAPASVQNRKGSLRVTTAAATTASGMAISYAPAADWPVGTAWTYSFWIKGPSGAKLGLYSGNPPNTTSTIITLNGDWQRFTQSSTIGSGATTGPQLVVRTPDTTQGAFTFWVSDIQLEKASAATGYFDGESPQIGDESTVWAGTRYASQSSAQVGVPAGYGVPAGGVLTRSYTTKRYNPTSVKVDYTGDTRVTPYVAMPMALPAGQVMASAWVYSPAGGTFYFTVQNGGTVLHTARILVTVPAGVWTEVRGEYTTTGAATQIVLFQTNAPGAVFYTAEMTAVIGGWTGSTFSGASQNSEGITCSWLGTPNASKSQAVFRNTNMIELGYNFFGSISQADSVVQLFCTPADNGNVAEWCWPADGAYSNANKAIVMYEAVMSDASIRTGWNFGFNGSFYIAEFDLAAKRQTRSRLFGRDPRGGKQCISWGGAVVTDQGYTYIYGSRGSGANVQNYVVRASAASAYDGPYSVWTSTGWVAAPAGADMGWLEIDAALPTPAPIGTTPDAGFSAVRTFRGKWKALAVGGFQKTLDIWTADNPQGPWTKETSAYTFPNTAVLYYSAKFQRGSDDNARGYAMMYCQSSADSITNPGLYIPAWIRGPKGAILAGAGGTEWKDRVAVDQAPEAYGNLNPGSVYSMRVRAVDNAGNTSAWATSQPVLISPDTSGPNKPSTPIVTAQFQGVRVLWDGLDTLGGAMPWDFAFYEVHISTDQSFTPNVSTLADKLATAGGTSPIQGLTYGTTYWVKLVAVDGAGNRSEASDGASATPTRLSDPDLPDKLITGAKLADGAVNTMKLTVAAFGENLIPNGGMEDIREDGTVAGWEGFFTSNPAKDTTNPIAGSGSLKVVQNTGNGIVIRTSNAIPITPGDTYYVSAKIRTDRELDAPSVGVYLSLADTAEKAGSGFGQDTALTVGSTVGGTSIATVEKGVETPWDETLKFGRIVLRFEPETTPYTAWVDDIEVRKITGEAAIAKASIGSAQIKNLAVDDAKIANLSVGKVTAGRIYSDWVQAARLMTPFGPNGEWSLMDWAGFHVFKDQAGTNKTFDTTAGNTWMSGVLEASEIRGGTGYFPSQYTDVPGRTILNDQGLSVDAVATVNLCPNPSLEVASTAFYASTGTSIIRGGAMVRDYAGNLDERSFLGTGSLKVWNTTANGYVDIPLGSAQPNTTYTASWYSAGTTINNSDPGWNSPYGDFGNMGVVRADTGAKIASGRTGYLNRDGALQGLWTQAKSSGIDTIAYTGGWNMRTYITFTTPSNLPANQQLLLRLPAPRTQAGGNETQLAVTYDGIQLEQKPYMTRYCDGSLPGCSWDGTPHNSTSRRNYIRSFWAPTQDEPVFQGNVRAPLIEGRKIKVGSGNPHGTNAIECFIMGNWEMWNSGSGIWWSITFDQTGSGTGSAGSARISEDDGQFRPNGSGRDFEVPVAGWYMLSCTITWPDPVQAGRLGLRVRHKSKNADDSLAVIRASTMREVPVSNGGSNSVTLTTVAYMWPGYYWYIEGFQTTQTGTAAMPGMGTAGAPPQSLSLVQIG